MIDVPPSLPRTTSSGKQDCPARRLAAEMMAVVESPSDVATLGAWAHLLRMGRGTLERRCHAAGAHPPKDALSLARLARVTMATDRGPWDPENALDVIDDRTRNALVKRGGVEKGWYQRRPTLAELLARHNFRVPLGVCQTLAALCEQRASEEEIEDAGR